MSWEHFAAVPGSDGASLVVVDGRLPRVRLDSWRLTDALAAFAPLIGEPVYLRLAAHAELADEHVVRLHVFDAADRGSLMGLADADPVRLAPPELGAALGRWLDEQRDGVVPALRPAWSRPGWHAQIEAWAGCRLQPLRIWPLSAVLRGELGGERVNLKAVFAGFHHEPAITAALAREHPGSVPDVLRIDRERGLLLMRELPDRPAEESFSEAPLRALAEIQEAWRDRGDELMALGAPDRRLVVLERSIAKLVSAVAPDLADAVPALEGACRTLAELGVAETIVHGDFHPGNAVIDDCGRAVIFDWSDACLAHPLFDRHLFRFHEDAAVVDDAPEAAPSCLHQAVSYRGIVEGLAPDDRWWFEGEPRRWLERAVALATPRG